MNEAKKEASAEPQQDTSKMSKEEEIVIHTEAPGSPFCNIKGGASKKDIKEAAIICAKFSQDWRDNRSDVVVNVFFGKHIYKQKSMKLGAFGVKTSKKLKVKKKDIEEFEREYETNKKISNRKERID